MSTDRLPSLPLPLPSQAYSSGASSSRVSSIASSIGSHAGSQSSFTSATSSNGPKTPSPTLPVGVITAPPTTIVSYDAMNQGADMYYPQHMSAGQPPPPQTVTSGGMTHYQQQQPPLLQHGHAQYSNPAQYSQYGYTNGLTSPPTAQTVSNPMGAPQNVLPLPGVGGHGPMQNQYAGFDTTGQQPPPGMKPRVTATLWEDEGSLCFQVEARGICVARREDNHMINGTKLLNVAGMTRGRRDGILKSEKVRHVVKIGPMHLKGVWIPYDRALDFANKEKITEMLYPLFVHNIGALLYHPNNQSRTTQVMAAAERRKQEQGQLRNPPPPGLPSIQQHHHHSMALPGPQPSLPSQSNIARPPLDRSQTFPTPPTSASSVMGSMGASESFNWQGQGMNGAHATTPPGTAMTNMNSYSSGAQAYDGSRQIYSAPTSQHSPYQTSTNGTQDRMYAQSYAKSEMGPPSSRPGGHQGEQHDSKPPNGIMASEQAAQHQAGDDEADHEHETEYTHDSGAYDASRTSYNYTAPGVGSLAGDGNMPSEMTGSPNHPPASGRATPRTAAPHQPYYPQHTGYSTPPRVPSSSNLFNVAGSDRAQHSGASGADVYAPPADIAGSMNNSYAPQSSVMNGSAGSLKRGRDDDDDDMSRSANGGPGMGGLELKRRKTLMESTVPAPVYDALSRPASAIAAPPRR
ncbi:cell pattern formation-associated protein stuA [Hirsutella rhossiliensis]|uniref:Cell pattern formation-associated protein stuA n=1 Tax=Hirsutella rhossiliensis TaxID=111463 RepID=A0A9P8MPT4_9HYPO|nr:cell pattern formation-associated protein stuA [Hirsutella rhossiliensis]KAH0959513.1 cell pattern formation-associated protein stuA [Hirsutella rhossiliensis]